MVIPPGLTEAIMKLQGIWGLQHERLGMIHGPWVPPAPKSKEETVLSGERGWCVASQPIAAGEQDTDVQTSKGLYTDTLTGLSKASRAAAGSQAASGGRRGG